jgi:hypothetical protein
MSDLLDMVVPQCFVHCLVELLVNGAYDSTFYDGIDVSSEFGQFPTSITSDYFLNHWQMSDDTSGSGNVGSMRVTLTHYADQMPMRWDWDWVEDGNTVSGFIELTGSTVTKTFTPSHTDFSTSMTSNIVFTAPI